jgi:hypothetical protein
MEIIKTETLRFSDCEQRSLDMAFMLMENISNCATDPELRRHAEHITSHLSDIYNYIEEE